MYSFIEASYQAAAVWLGLPIHRMAYSFIGSEADRVKTIHVAMLPLGQELPGRRVLADARQGSHAFSRVSTYPLRR